MGFWEITFLVWAAGVVVMSFLTAAFDDHIQDWGLVTIACLLLWPMLLAALAGARIRYWRGR